MENKEKLVIVSIVLVLLLGCAYIGYNYLSKDNSAKRIVTSEEVSNEDTSETEKEFAPDFIVYDRDGLEVRLSDFVGKPTVVNFWASWCGPCQMEMPDFEEKYLAYGKEINFMMVNMTDNSRETVSVAYDFIDEKGYTFPVYCDTKSSAANTYSVYSLPTTYFIDAQGYIVAQAVGAIDSETLQKGIDMITEVSED